MSYEHQDWIPVVIRNSAVAKKEKQHRQNPEGTKEFHKLNDDDVPVLDKITPEQSKALREARAAKGISQADFAKSLNINVAIVKEYENGTVAKFNKRMYNTLMRRLGVKA